MLTMLILCSQHQPRAEQAFKPLIYHLCRSWMGVVFSCISFLAQIIFNLFVLQLEKMLTGFKRVAWILVGVLGKLLGI